MPINTNLSTAPYFDDYSQEAQYYRVLFKPGYAVQARELTQLQTVLQNQIEQFGDNIYKEGSIIKGCNFTTINGLEFVKLKDGNDLVTNFDPTAYVSRRGVENINGVDTEIDYVYEIIGETSGLKAIVISGVRGFSSAPPNLNTFFIGYTNTDTSLNLYNRFIAGEKLTVSEKKFKVGGLDIGETNPIQTTAVKAEIDVSDLSNHVGQSYGLRAESGVIFQKGHFLFAEAQTLIVSKYTRFPDQLAVGYRVAENLVNAFEDPTLYDNANGSSNFNAPGADRLKLVPSLTVLSQETADADASFFSLIRFSNGNQVTVRDIAEYNVLGDEMARRTFEESGNYIVKNFKTTPSRRGDDLKIGIGPGTAYIKGYRIENLGEQFFTVDPISNSEIIEDQTVSFKYGQYVDVLDWNGYIDLDRSSAVDLKNSSSTKIGEAFVNNIVDTRIHLSGVRMNPGENFATVERVDVPTGYIEIANTAVEPARLKGTDNQAFIFETGLTHLKNTICTKLPIREVTAASVDSGTDQIIISSGPDGDFYLDQDDLLVIEDTGTKLTIQSSVVENLGTQLRIQIDPAEGAGGSAVHVYYNRNRTGNTAPKPFEKLAKETHVKITHVFDTQNNRWSLGFPDVYEIIGIVDSNGDDYTNSFRLIRNQKDTYYDISYIEYIQGRPIPPNSTLTVELKVFEINPIAGRSYYFAVNSYPATLDYDDIPVYTSSNGRKHYLRECFDFRPYADKEAAADYNATNPATAPNVSGAVGASPTFTTLVPITPVGGGVANLDIEHFLARVDAVTVDSYGTFNIIKGREERNPTPPSLSPDQMVLAEVKIPGSPALTPAEALAKGIRPYGVSVIKKSHKGYKMQDIKRIDDKVNSLNYYISLSQLESSTQNLSILDENGRTRFKNGFVVDPFNDLTFAEIADPEYNAAILHNQKILTPAVKQFALDLKYSSATRAQLFPPTNNPNVMTLGRDSNLTVLNQPYATEFRNCVSNYYAYNGLGGLSPEYDIAYDFTQNPDPLTIDTASMFEDFVDNLQEFLPLTDALTEQGIAVNTFGRAGGTVIVDDTFSTLEVDSATEKVGDFVTNVEFNPFIAARELKVWVGGLRPDTNHYFFFDGVDVNAHIVPGTAADSPGEIETFGDPIGAAGLKTDSRGVLRAVFNIPEATFFVGDRILKVVDVDQYNSIDSAATSSTSLTYRAYNFSIEKTELSTREPEFNLNETVVARSVTFPRRGDPLAQTFYIKKGMVEGGESLLVSELDVYFKRKSEVNGITLYLSETDNGYPSGNIIPFSKVHYTKDQVNVSDDASAATTFQFEAPIRLYSEREYAFVVMPDGNDPDYLIYTSKVGGLDLSPGDTQGQAIVQDWGDGVLFTSTNNRAWKSYQDEDVKFELRRHSFDENQGFIRLKNNDHEFLSVNDISGRFNFNEDVYQLKDLAIATSNVVSMEVGNNVITGSGLDTTYAINDEILINDSTNKDIFRITDITSATRMVAHKQTPYDFVSSSGLPVVSGKLSHYDKRNPGEMYLEGSSAREGRKFDQGVFLYGLSSGSQANTASIDDINISYIQPFINRTNDGTTSTSLTGRFTSPNDVNTYYEQQLKFNSNNYFSKSGAVIYSKSNDLTDTKKFEIIVDMKKQAGLNTSSPLVDVELSKLIAYQWKITNSSSTTAKYISKRVELAESFDAEDFQLIITGYRPQGTDIKCYIKPQNVYDSEGFENIDWVELEIIEGKNTFSSKVNIEDYKEFKFAVPDSAKNADGALEYTSDAGTFTGYRRFAVKIEMLSSTGYNAPSLRDYRGIALT